MKIEIYSPTIRRKEMDAVLTAMVEEKIGPGDRNRLLIQTAKEQIHFDFALALRSPAVALHLALKAVIAGNTSGENASCRSSPFKQGVVISALSPRYYLQVIEDLQLTPLFCDVSFDFPCMNRQTIENTIAKKHADIEVCAVVLHHTLGYAPDTAAVAELGIPVIEDISQSYGSHLKPANKKDEETPAEDNHSKKDDARSTLNAAGVSLSGVLFILGLEERDMLTSGGGALLFAMNRRDGSLLRGFTGIAYEYCLPDINAALAVVQFRELPRNIERRQEISRVYNNAGMRSRHKRFIPVAEDEYNNYSFSLVLETGLKDVIAYARKKEITVESAFENTLAGCGLSGDCPVSNSLALRTVIFPIYPRLRTAEAERVSKLIMTLP
ncbi:MAG: DegT/DnrJ/EryC1/StrS family aminotransferase [Treponema sp.]|jgi:dTDP-4-amino-4,6-dideoxygalactose transaminase|nr:DegT/DnrJ/EryC1/StrS family aminotransferase [Treponema sp.]